MAVCELCYNSHPVVILGPPSMTSRRVLAILGIRPESVGNPPGIRLIGSTRKPVHEPTYESAVTRGSVAESLCKNSPRKNIGLLMIGCLSRQKSRDIFYMYLFLKNLVFVQSLTSEPLPPPDQTSEQRAE